MSYPKFTIMKCSHFPVAALAALAGLALAAGSAHGALLLYEGFDYTDVGDELIGKGGTTESGLSGTWADAAETSGAGNDMYLKSGSLNFSNLATSGNHIGFNSHLNNDIYHRAITTTGFVQPTIYFSFLFEKLESRNNADREGFALMNGVLGSSRFDSGNLGSVGVHGFAVAATDNSNMRAIAYNGTDGTRIVSTSAISTPSVSGGTNTGASNVDVKLIVGEISFNTGTGGADVFKLYNASDDGSLDASDLTLIDTIEADVDESLLSTLNLTRQVNVNYDEIRIGTTLESVIVQIPEPAAALLGSLGLLALLRRRR